MKFLGGALKALNPIYRIQGGMVGTDQIDLSGSIQLVHDVAREAELAAAYGAAVNPGWWEFDQAHVHAGADTVRAVTNPRTTIDAATQLGGPPPYAYDVWLMRAGLHGAAAVINGGQLALVTPAANPWPGGATAVINDLVAYWTGQVAVSDLTAAGDLYSGTPVVQFNNPILIPPTAVLSGQSSSSGAGTISISMVFWVGPQGTLPPGMA